MVVGHQAVDGHTGDAKGIRIEEDEMDVVLTVDASVQVEIPGWGAMSCVGLGSTAAAQGPCAMRSTMRSR